MLSDVSREAAEEEVKEEMPVQSEELPGALQQLMANAKENTEVRDEEVAPSSPVASPRPSKSRPSSSKKSTKRKKKYRTKIKAR